MTQAVNVPGVGTLNFPDGMSQQDMATAIQKNFPQIHPSKTDPDAGSRLLGGVEELLNTGAKAIAAPVAGLAGFLSPSGKEEQNMAYIQQHTPQFNPTDQRTQEGMRATQDTLGAIASLPQTLAEKGQDLITKGISQPNSPQYQAQLAQDNAKRQAGSNIAANIAPLLFGPKGVPSPIKVVGKADFETNPVLAAHQAGYPIAPSEAAIHGAPAPIGTVMEGLSGSAKLRTSNAIKAQARTNQLAAQDIGAPEGPLTEGVLNNLRKPHNAVYQEVQSLSGPYGKIQPDSGLYQDLNKIRDETANGILGSNPDIQSLLDRVSSQKAFSTDDLVKTVKSLRQNARSNYKASNAMQVKNAYDLGDLADAQKGVADSLENQLDRFVQNIPGKEDLVKRWRNARQSLAKINSVDNAMKEGSTDVSAPALAKQAAKGTPFSGNLKTIVDMTNTFPRLMTEPAKLGNKVPVNMWETMTGGGLGGTALYLHNPVLAATAGATLVGRPMIRAGLLGDSYQKALAGAQTPMSPFVRSMIDPTVLQALQTGNKQ